jgi:YD repeat-containing protein
MDEYSYSYDGAHNQTSKTETINGIQKGITSYTYDRLNRLTEIQEPVKAEETSGRNTSYTYDAAGNRETERTTTSKAAGTKTTLITYKYNEQNRLMSATEEIGDGTKKTTTYTYDGNGNMTRKSMEQTRQIDPSNAPKARFGIYIEGQAEVATKNAKPIVSGIASYEYNEWNQLKKATTGEGTSTYKYNGEGYRTEKTENGKTTISLYEADKVILETDANGKETARNLYGTNLITRTVTENTTTQEGGTAQGSNAAQASNAAQGSSTTQNGSAQKTSYNYMYNGHGDVTALLTQDGTIAASYYYDAFGPALETHYYNASGAETDKAVNNPYRYAGYVFDSTTDLYYLA